MYTPLLGGAALSIGFLIAVIANNSSQILAHPVNKKPGTITSPNAGTDTTDSPKPGTDNVPGLLPFPGKQHLSGPKPLKPVHIPYYDDPVLKLVGLTGTGTGQGIGKGEEVRIGKREEVLIGNVKGIVKGKGTGQGVHTKTQTKQKTQETVPSPEVMPVVTMLSPHNIKTLSDMLFSWNLNTKTDNIRFNDYIKGEFLKPVPKSILKKNSSIQGNPLTWSSLHDDPEDVLQEIKAAIKDKGDKDMFWNVKPIPNNLVEYGKSLFEYEFVEDKTKLIENSKGHDLSKWKKTLDTNLENQKTKVVVFMSESKGSMLIVPQNGKNYSFNKYIQSPSITDEDKILLIRSIGDTVQKIIKQDASIPKELKQYNGENIWVLTDGTSIPWLHVRVQLHNDHVRVEKYTKTKSGGASGIYRFLQATGVAFVVLSGLAQSVS